MVLLVVADPKGGLHQWKYGEGEGEEVVEERKKIEREEEEETSPPSIMFCIHHWS
jgi:hypothetical protein